MDVIHTTPIARHTTGAIDAHFHCWQLARGDYGWLTPDLGDIHRDVAVDDWTAESRRCGVVAGVLVQAAPTDAETAFLLAQAQAHERVLGVVGWTDLSAGDAPGRIEALARQPGLVGLRPMLQDLPDPDWILRPEVAAALDAMAACGLAFDALVKPVHLPRIRRLMDRHPDLRVVIDHGAKPDIASGAWQPWADEMDALARETSVRCKLSGLLTECGAHPAPTAARRWARHLVHAFGFDRLLWGSDWPVLELAARYDTWWQETLDLLDAAGATPAQRAAVLGGNARAFYRLDAEGST
ncbi:MAG: amidohydrolase family protein [Rubrivivax sp.]